MRLTPFGKLLLFLIGVGLIAVALTRFVPREQQFWRAWFGGKASAPSPTPTSPREGRPAEREAAAGAAQEWVSIPGGALLAGEQGSSTDVPAFRIQRHEVTNGEYRRYLDGCPVGSACGPRGLPSYWDDAAYVASHLDFPVVFVAWEDAAAFCRQAGGRLPTSTEWERAARGNDARLFPWGDSLDAGSTNILGADHSVKQRAEKQIPTWAVSDPRYRRDQSAFGVYGLGGNVSEWTSTRNSDEPDLVLVAGGSWDSWELSDARVFARVGKLPTDRSSSVGFRCVASR